MYTGITADTTRQTVFIFGNSNQIRVLGMITINSNTQTCYWYGIDDNVSVSRNNSGLVTVTLPTTTYDVFVLISGNPIS